MTPHHSKGIGIRRILGALGLVAALAVSGCGDDNSITDPNPGTGDGTGVASLELLTSNVQVPSVGSLSPEIIALARDANNTVVEGATVVASGYSPKRDGIKGSGNWEPVAVTAGYGKGRCFATLLGHDVTMMQNDGFKELLIRGVRWAAGRAN